LGAWLLTRARHVGPIGAIAELRGFMDSQYCEMEEYLALSGLEISSAISLPGGVDLIPMSDVPESELAISLWTPIGPILQETRRDMFVAEPSRFS
jgi:hypothetical protein